LPNTRGTCTCCCQVNNEGNVLLDTFVAPSEAVTDYRTAVSGVRPADLVGAPSFTEVGGQQQQQQQQPPPPPPPQPQQQQQQRQRAQQEQQQPWQQQHWAAAAAAGDDLLLLTGSVWVIHHMVQATQPRHHPVGLLVWERCASSTTDSKGSSTCCAATC
jgi:hypothetical protein